MTITLEQLLGIVPSLGMNASAVLGPLNQTMEKFSINTPTRIGMFIANVAAESAGFTAMEENLNYTAIRLSQVWPRRFSVNGRPNNLALSIEKKPRDIANNVYADRMGNGNVLTGDGFKYRGRGWLMLTGKDNYRSVGAAIGVDLLSHPDNAAEINTAALVAGYFWNHNGCNASADANDFDGCCDKINIGRKTEKIGDAIGYNHRKEYWLRASKVLKIS